MNTYHREDIPTDIPMLKLVRATETEDGGYDLVLALRVGGTYLRDRELTGDIVLDVLGAFGLELVRIDGAPSKAKPKQQDQA